MKMEMSNKTLQKSPVIVDNVMGPCSVQLPVLN